MKERIISLAAGVALAFTVSLSHAGGHAGWALNAEASNVAFASVKADKVGEVHSFSSISGGISEQGQATVEIDVASVQTNIDIRNERMLEWVFTNGPTATLSADVDMDAVTSMAAGDTSTMDISGTLTLNGVEVPVDTSVFVAMLSDSSLLVTTNDMVLLSTEQAGLTAGVDKLMELAGLPGITRVSPVTLRLLFVKD